MILKLYNNTFIRGRNIDDSKISPAALVIKEVARQGFNLELKLEERIVQDIRRTEEKVFLESMKTTPFDLVSSLMFSFQNDDNQNQLQKLLKLIDDKASELKEISEFLKNNQNKSEFMELMNNFLKNIR